jgi:predicted nucleotidyltransferase
VGPSTISTETLARIADPEIQRFLREKWELIEKEFEPSHFILFGSRINGVPHEWSDIDAIIVSEKFSTIRFPDRSFEFKKVIDPHIAMTVLCYPLEEFEYMRTGIGVVADACREGLWVK